MYAELVEGNSTSLVEGNSTKLVEGNSMPNNMYICMSMHVYLRRDCSPALESSPGPCEEAV